jgi:hypothetical protein
MAIDTVWPSLVSHLASVLPILPAPMIPMFIR